MATAYSDIQLITFFYSIIFGLGLGIIYDFFRLIRRYFNCNIVADVCCDIIFMLINALLTFLFIVSFNSGIIRIYIIAGEFLGFIFYRYTIGKFSIIIILKVNYWIRNLFKMINKPFVFIKNQIKKFIKLISSKYFKKSKKKCDKDLKSTDKMLYNKQRIKN